MGSVSEEPHSNAATRGRLMIEGNYLGGAVLLSAHDLKARAVIYHSKLLRDT